MKKLLLVLLALPLIGFGQIAVVSGCTDSLALNFNPLANTDDGFCCGAEIILPPFGTQLGQDINGEAVSDWSGYSVSLSADGTTLAIGAPYNNGNAFGSGHVRVYQNVAGTWSQIGSDINGEAYLDFSGHSVSLSSDGATVAIGAYYNNGSGPYSGHVRVYQNVAGSWVQIGQDINGEAADDYSGFSVSLSADGATLAIGAFTNDGNGTNSGHVRVYQNVAGAWSQLGQDINGEAADDCSGVSVSLSADGSTLAIGASGNDGNGSSSGHVRVYQNVAGTWSQIDQDINGEAAGDESGHSVSLSSDGATVAIGAYANDGNGTTSGHVRVYQNVAGTWSQIGQDINGEAAGDFSGVSVSLSADGSILAIGAPSNDGHVRVYQNVAGSWSQVGSDINGEAAGDESGYSVSLSSDGSILAIGARNNNGNGYNSGHVRVYSLGGTNYTSPACSGCTDALALNYDPYSLIDDGSCIAVVNGCMDNTMFNFSPLANTDDGSCIPFIYGCIDVSACNYEALSNTDDGSCIFAPTNADCLGTCLAGFVSVNGACVAIVYGCTDITQFNFSPLANTDDGSCIPFIYGCMDVSACNYEALANTDDGSCIFAPTNADCLGTCLAGFVSVNGACVAIVSGCTDATACNYSASANVNSGCSYGATIPYSQNFEALTVATTAPATIGAWANTNTATANATSFGWLVDYAGTPTTGTGPQGGTVAVPVNLSLTVPDGSGTPGGKYIYLETSVGALGNSASLTSPCYALSSNPCLSFNYHMYGVTTGSLEVLVNGASVWSLSGNQGNMWSAANVPLAAYGGQSVTIVFKATKGSGTTGDIALDNISIANCALPGCTNPLAINYNPAANTENGSCIPYVYGCMDNTQFNYNAAANTDDGSCIPFIYGCTDISQFNYNPAANTENGSCIPYVYGCMDNTQFNYNAAANTDDGSCIPFIYGCTDISQFNYSANANTDDGSCIAVVSGCTDSLALNFNPLANTDDGFCCGAEIILPPFGTQLGQDINGEAVSDWSGYSVSLSADGTTLAIGAPYNNGNAFGSGHVRVYQNVAGTWSQIGQDINGEAAEDESGCSVSISADGATLAIGAIGNDGNGSWSGHVRVYQNVGGTWSQIGSDINGEAAGDESGFSVSLSADGATVAIGAPYNDGNGYNSGHVRVYQNVAGSWSQVGQDINGEAADDYSGYSVSLSADGATLAIGAIYNNGSGPYSGHVRVYKNVAGSWVQIGQDINGEAASDESGYSVSLSADGATLAIGAYLNDGNGADAGHVRVYQNVAGSWSQIGSDINGEAASDESGYSVSLSADGSILAIGALFNDENGPYSGHVRVYKNVAGSWSQIGSDINGEAAGDESGYSVSLSSDGSTLAIGAPYNNENGPISGHVRVYSLGGTNYTSPACSGCTDALALNYDPYSLIDDGSCIAVVNGCMDNTMFNFNPLANTNDGSCIAVVLGCTDPASFNYNSSANTDDGSCIAVVTGCTDPASFNYNSSANTDDGSCIAVVTGCTDPASFNYNSSANTDDGSCIAVVTGCTDPASFNYNSSANTDDGSCIAVVTGCTDPASFNYNSSANTDDGSCIAVVTGCTDPASFNYNSSANTDDGSCIAVVTGCTDPASFNYNSSANTDDGSCIAVVLGCTDPASFNYNSSANTNDGSCIAVVTGCTDPASFNYNSSANTDDGSCIAVVTGCTDPASFNYNSSANTNDGSCIAVVTGCTDPASFNYNSSANTDDGSCIAVVLGCTDPASFNYNSSANTDDGSCIPFIYGCIDVSACNYEALSNTDDGSCIFAPTNADCLGTCLAGFVSVNGACVAIVYGCTDITQFNFSPLANTDDGSCIPFIYGCMDVSACNYEALANTDDGSCIFAPTNADCLGTCLAGFVSVNGACVAIVSGCTDATACNYSASANVNSGCSYGATIPYSQNFEALTVATTAPATIGAWANTNTATANATSFGWLVDYAGTPTTGTGPQGGTVAVPVNLSLTVPDGSGTPGGKYIYLETSVGALGNSASLTSPCYALSSNPCLSFNYHMYGVTTGSLEVLVNGASVWSLSGNQGNMWSAANVPLAAYGGQSVTIVFKATKGSGTTGDIALDNISIANCALPGCTNPLAFNYNAAANTDDGSCIPFIYGCTDISQFNYSANANTDDGSCIPFIYGCTDISQFNYNPAANTENGSCIPYVYGCMDNTQFNYNAAANTDDGSCIPFIYGCTDISQFNYSANANTDDGSCIAVVSGCTDSLALNFNPLANTDDGFCCGAEIILPPFGTQLGQDINGEAAGDHSGFSVSLSADGSTVAIGAPYNNGNGSSSGHVRVYQNVAGAWSQIGQDINGEAADDYSGVSVSLSADGATLAIGARENDGNGNNSGHVRVYQNVAGTWSQIGSDINGEAASDYSGYSVSLSADGATLAIGAPYNNGNGYTSGHVRVYQNVAGSWSQIGSDINGEAADDYSGYSVSLSADGSTVAIGAYYNDGNGSYSGHVRVYQNIAGSWSQIGQDINGEAAEDESGCSVSISADGATLAIGAIGNDGNGSWSGHVRVYQNVGGTWSQIGSDINGEAAGDESGFSVSLSADGATVAIGAPYNDGNGYNSGHVRVYQNVAGSWSQVGQDINGEAASDYSGYSVSLSADGSILAIGARNNNGNGYTSGHVRVYSLGGTNYTSPACSGCTDALALNYDPYSLIDDGSCIAVVNGCMDNTMFNFNPLANTDDGSCIPFIYGCIDVSACNYEALANTDDGSCTYAAANANCAGACLPGYVLVNGACVVIVTGCTNSTATNYNALANTACVGCCVFPTTCSTNAAPTGLFVDGIIHTRATINWTNMNSTTCFVDQYRIQYRKVGNTAWLSKTMGAPLGTCGANGTTGIQKTDKELLDLLPSTTYQYQMKAWYCGGGVSSWTTTNTFTTAGNCPNISNLTVTTPTTTKATFTWSTSNGAYSFVRLKARVDTLSNPVDADWFMIGGSGVNYPAVTKDKNGLLPGQTYRGQGRTFCDPNGGAYMAPSWTALVTWTQPTSIRLEGGESIANLDVYPNPSRDVFNVTFTSEDVQDLEVRVINIVGEVVYTENLQQFVGEYTKQINLKDNAKGIYFLEITTDNGVVNKKLILQ